MTIVLIILVVLALPYLIRKQSKVILVGCHVRCRKKCCFMCNIGVSRSKCFFALKSNSFILTCGKKQNTVKTEEKHEQRNESQFGADNVCPRYADYGVSVLPAVMYGETDYAATSENKSNRRVVKCLRFSILLDKTGVFRHMQQSHSIIQRLIPSAGDNVEINRKHGKHCPLRKTSRVCF